jgi:hypothetical protein
MLSNDGTNKSSNVLFASLPCDVYRLAIYGRLHKITALLKITMTTLKQIEKPLKGFLSPKLRDQFWVNPSLFFKGDRVAFITEYKRTNKTER